MKRIILDCKKDYTMAIKFDKDVIEDFFVIKNDSNVGDVCIGRVENIRGKQCFVNYDEKRKNGIMETKGKDLKVGDYIKCQVVREEMEDKGAILDRKINLAGNFVILSSTLSGYKYSHRLLEEKIETFKKHLDKTEYGFIIRKQAGEVPLEAVSDEIETLSMVFREIEKSKPNDKICSIYSENKANKTLNEINPYGCKVISNDKEFSSNYEFEIYNDILPILDYYGLRKSVKDLFERKVSLNCGIELVIDKTEAMYIIDVNLKGYFGGKNDIGNKIAGKEIARQIRLRNLSGLIVVDFITTRNTEEIVNYLNELFLEDREKAEVAAVPNFSIVAINRKKRYNNFKSIFFQSCSCCEGCGEQKTIQYLCQELAEDAIRLYHEMKYKNIVISLEPKLFNEMKKSESSLYFSILPSMVGVYIKQVTDKKGSSFEITDDTFAFKEALKI